MDDKPRLFQNTYLVGSARLKGWNYANPGWYFITICTKGRYPWFGDIRDQVMHLSDVGQIVHQYWRSIPRHFVHIELDQFVIMPDHLHGIIVFKRKPNVETCDSHVSTGSVNIKHIVRPEPGSLGSIINQFKSTCTKRIRNAGYTDFSWQPRFHDRRIRSEDETIRIRTYIQNNPLQIKENNSW